MYRSKIFDPATAAFSAFTPHPPIYNQLITTFCRKWETQNPVIEHTIYARRSVFFTRFLTALHFTGSRKWLILNINEIPHSAIATFGMTTTAKKERRSGGGDAQIQNEYQAFAAAASSQTPTYMSFRRSEATEESQAISNT